MSTARNRLLFAAPQLRELRKELLAENSKESACIVFAHSTLTRRGGHRFLVAEVMHARPQDYVARSQVDAELTPDFMVRAARKAQEKNYALFLTHTHPHADAVAPSSVDRVGESSWVPAVRRRAPAIQIGRVILGANTAHAAIITQSEALSVTAIEVGDEVAFETDGEAGSSDALHQIHDRQVRSFGAAGQRLLRELCIAVVGLGGTGSVVAEQLAHLGIGEMLFIDPDTIEVTNLNRVVGAVPNDVGGDKVRVAAEMVRRINPSIRLATSKGDIQDARELRALLDADFFFCCTDSDGSRAVLNQLAHQYLIPGIDVGVAIRSKSGSVTRIVGRVQMITPSQPCLLCAEVLDAEQVRRDLLSPEERAKDRYIVDEPVPQPAVVSINALASSFAVTMMLSALTGIPLASRYQLLRIDSGVVSRAAAERAPMCPVCSDFGVRGKGDVFPFPGRHTTE